MREISDFIHNNIGDFTKPPVKSWTFSGGGKKNVNDLEIESYFAKPNSKENKANAPLGYNATDEIDQVKFIVENSTRILLTDIQCTQDFTKSGRAGRFLDFFNQLTLINKVGASLSKYVNVVILFYATYDSITNNDGMFNYFDSVNKKTGLNHRFDDAYNDVISTITLANYPYVQFMGYAIYDYTLAREARP